MVVRQLTSGTILHEFKKINRTRYAQGCMDKSIWNGNGYNWILCFEKYLNKLFIHNRVDGCVIEMSKFLYDSGEKTRRAINYTGDRPAEFTAEPAQDI